MSMATPISTYQAVLKYGATSSPSTTIDIKSFPQILAPRTSLETTTMSDDARTYIQGIRETPDSFDFTCNWDKTVFNTINSLTAEQYCELDFSDGSSFSWKGYMSAANNDGDVNAVVEMTISVTPTTVPVFAAGT